MRKGFILIQKVIDQLRMLSFSFVLYSVLLAGCNEVTDNAELAAANNTSGKTSTQTQASKASSAINSQAIAAASDVVVGKNFIDSTGNIVAGAMPLGSQVSAPSGSLSVSIPLGYYDGSQLASFSDSKLVPQNIVSGVSIFGVTGTSAGTTVATCTSENQTGCVSNSTYPTQATPSNPASASDVVYGKEFFVGGSKQTGTMVARGSTWDLTTAFPGSGYYTGVTSGITLSKVCTTQNVLGQAGTASCISGSTSTAATAGDIIAGKECWNSSGAIMTGTYACTNRGTLDFSVTLPGAGYYSATPSNTPGANNLCSGTTVLGTTGTAICDGSTATFGHYAASNQNRDKATTQITLRNEAVTNAGTSYTNADPGYRAVPKISKDDDGYSGSSVTWVSRTSWNSCTAAGALTGGSSACICGGSSFTTISAKIADCAAHSVIGSEATWNGSTKGNSGQGTWKLVTRTGSLSSSKGREVWQDQRTGLLWSSLVSTSLNWCRASGSNYITDNSSKENDPSGLCILSAYQNTGATGQAISACFEDDGTNFKQLNTNASGGYDANYVSGAIDSNGKGGLSKISTPAVGWRLPTVYDYQQANVNGLRFVMPDRVGFEWASTITGGDRSKAWAYQMYGGYLNQYSRTSENPVRCVGR